MINILKILGFSKFLVNFIQKSRLLLSIPFFSKFLKFYVFPSFFFCLIPGFSRFTGFLATLNKSIFFFNMFQPWDLILQVQLREFLKSHLDPYFLKPHFLIKNVLNKKTCDFLRYKNIRIP